MEFPRRFDVTYSPVQSTRAAIFSTVTQTTAAELCAKASLYFDPGLSPRSQRNPPSGKRLAVPTARQKPFITVDHTFPRFGERSTNRRKTFAKRSPVSRNWFRFYEFDIRRRHVGAVRRRALGSGRRRGTAVLVFRQVLRVGVSRHKSYAFLFSPTTINETKTSLNGVADFLYRQYTNLSLFGEINVVCCVGSIELKIEIL